MAAEYPVRWGWLKFMYWYTLFGAGFFGVALLAAPEWAKRTFGFPEQDPIMLGAYAGALVAFAALSVLGLRAPLRFVPVLCLQLLYKSVWMVVVILPLLAVGELPAHAPMLIVIFLSYIIGDLIAIPFGHVFAREGSASPDD